MTVPKGNAYTSTVSSTLKNNAFRAFRLAVFDTRSGHPVGHIPPVIDSVKGRDPPKISGFPSALEAQVSTVSAGMDGTRGIASWRDRLLCPGRVWVFVGEPISTMELNGEDRDALMERVRWGLLPAQTRPKVL